MALTKESKKRSTPHEQRRRGDHHKQNKRYHNTYWPYLPLALIVGLGILLHSFWPTVQSAVLGYATNTSVTGLVQETNMQRTRHSVDTLQLNQQLNAAAQAKAEDMAARDYWSHQTPEGSEPWTFIAKTNYEHSTAGENLAYGFSSSQATVAGWMGSPSHKQNILNETYQEVGFGIAHSDNFQGLGEQTIVVAMYASPANGVVAGASSQSADTGTQTAIQTGTPLTAQQVARVQLISPELTAWAILSVSIIALTAAGVFIIRHSLFWHRMLVRGERFAIRHHFFDVILAVIAVGAVVLAQSAGVIH